MYMNKQKLQNFEDKFMLICGVIALAYMGVIAELQAIASDGRYIVGPIAFGLAIIVAYINFQLTWANDKKEVHKDANNS